MQLHCTIVPKTVCGLIIQYTTSANFHVVECVDANTHQVHLFFLGGGGSLSSVDPCQIG